MILPHETARCEGHGVGASGHQLRVDCVNCARRLASRPAGMTQFMEPAKEFPCESRIPVEGGKE